MDDASHSHRPTRQRAAVTALLDRTDGFRSAQDLHGQLRDAGDGVGLTTMYRALERMAEAGEVDVLRNGAGEALYRRCRTSDHHHLVCRGCGLAMEVDGPADVEQWMRRTADAHGFTEASHSLGIYGRCRDCSAAS